MKLALLSASNAPRRSGSVIAELLAEGVSRADIDTALALQKVQRGAGVVVHSLRTIIHGRADARPAEDLGLSASPAGRLLSSPPAPRPRRGGTHITGRPVWGGSVQTESAAEAEFVRPLHDAERKRLKAAAYATFLRAQELARERRAGTRELSSEELKLIGFTSSCRDILLKLLDHAAFHKGWCMPSWETIQTWVGRSRKTVARSLAVLADVGLAQWIRRFIYTRDPKIGARSEQTSNLYRFALPGWLAKLIGIAAPPIPDDELQRRADAERETALMLASASPAERHRLMPRDDGSRARLVLAAHGTCIGDILAAHHGNEGNGMSRECHSDTAPHIESYINRRNKWNRPSRPIDLP